MTVKMAMKTNQCYPRYGYDSKESNQDRGLHMCDPLVETPEKHGRLLELLMLLFSCGKISYSVCCMQKNIYCSLTSHVLPVDQPMRSQEVKQGYKCGRRQSICSAL